jgi:hypothetical protein
VPILRMRVWAAHHVLRPMDSDDVNAGFCAIAVKHRAGRANAKWALLLFLAGEDANESHFVFFRQRSSELRNSHAQCRKHD